jgi:DUF1365 family protein
MTMLSSAVYEGRVTHRRHAPHAHAFSYRMAQLYLDLDEIEEAFRDRWLWSVGRSNLAEWRRSDYMGPTDLSLSDAVRQCVQRETGHEPQGPIRMLSHLRYAGHVFNPVTFYYCFHADGMSLDSIVAEITNTPWGERHAYVLPAASSDRRGRALSWCFDKQFHVSPFMAMERRYDWRFTTPSDDLRVHMKVCKGSTCEFDATLTLQRHPLDNRSLARVLWRYPLMTAQVVGAIHWQAFRLWLKRNPVHAHPESQPTRGHGKPDIPTFGDPT